MRVLAVVLVALFLTACSGSAGQESGPLRPLIAQDEQSGLTAVSAVGARSVKLLHVRPPSIVPLREVFVPAGEHVLRLAVAPAGRTVIVETDVARFALDARSGRLALLDTTRPAFAAADAQPRD
jgi:hypothetical protein